MLEQYASTQDFWQKIPFLWLMGIVLAFWIGLIVQDCYNKDSWVRRIIKSFRKLFVIENVISNSKIAESREWVEVRCRVRFIRNKKNVSVVIRAYSCINALARRDFILETHKLDQVYKDQQLTFVLAILPIKSYNKEPLGYQCWGQRYRKSGDIDGMVSLGDGSQNLVEIEVKSGWKTQTEHIFFAVMHKNSHEHGRVFIVHKNRPVPLTIEPQDAINS